MKTRDKYIAEDITQETFLKFLNNHSYEEMGKQMAYLYTIARNLCIDYYRKIPECELDDNISDPSVRENSWLRNKYRHVNRRSNRN